MSYPDVVVIGGGVVGAATARAFSRYQVDVVLLEKEPDLPWGTTRANSGIVHSGHYDRPGTAKARLCVRGNRLLRRLAAELNVPYRQNGSLTVAFTPEEAAKLSEWYARGRANGVPRLRLISGRTAARLEPNLAKEVLRALHAPTAGVVSPYELALALVENAVTNGVELRLESPVEGLRPAGKRLEVATPGESYFARLVVNAAGLGAEGVARMVGDETVALRPRRGEEYLLDKVYGSLVTRTIFPTAAGYSKGILVIPTAEGNLMLGPTDVPDSGFEDLFTTAEGYAAIAAATRRLVPSLPGPEAVIASFAGLRATSATGDFVIGPSPTCPQLIHAAGIDSPGLTAAPAIAEEILFHAQAAGLKLQKKREWRRGRPAPVRFRELDDKARAALAAADPAYRHVVCRCELVTEAEIVEAVRQGARTLDGVKLRTRAGMGRCQGGFCTTKVMAILARELDLPYTALTKRGLGSEIVVEDLARRGGEGR
ncbi:MAG: NAD(P)/FAD-dependent oxidoreductase [Bacillota bacterium]|nr:NAD(P)/FAD-dependent oxidoreductase [Bacillota bacterium]